MVIAVVQMVALLKEKVVAKMEFILEAVVTQQKGMPLTWIQKFVAVREMAFPLLEEKIARMNVVPPIIYIVGQM